MQLGFDLIDLLREAEDDCPNCWGMGTPECTTCHGKGKVVNYIGQWLIKFIARHADEIAAVRAASGD